jgi:hypothetical protein
MVAIPTRLGRAEYTVSTSVLTLSSSPDAGDTLPGNASTVFIQTEDENIRVSWDGEDPTATLGIQVTSANSPLIISDRSALENLKMIREGATNAAVNVAYL